MRKFALLYEIKLNMECYGDTKEEIPDTVGFEVRIGGSFRADLIRKFF